MRQITDWKKPSYNFDSEYGFINFDNWCEKEISRLGVENHIIKTRKGLISIWRKG